MAAYYNENDPGAAAWLRELIKAGIIADGVVDERSILDVRSVDLRGFTQCHFFAGIGGWSYALRLAGWNDDRPVWTGSPPCQPFSVAGRGLAADDPRHLAPHFLDLVRACRPGVLFGEQVASAAVFGKAAKPTRKSTVSPPEWAWLDDVSDRLEAAHYAVGAVDFPSAGVGAPHIRQRTYFVGIAHEWEVNSLGAGLEGQCGNVDGSNEPGRLNAQQDGSAREASATGGLEHGSRDGRLERGGEPGRRRPVGICASERMADNDQHGRKADTVAGFYDDKHNPEPCSGVDRMADSDGRHAGTERIQRGGQHGQQQENSVSAPSGGAGPTNGFWANADWLGCRDGKWRPVEPGLEPLAYGVSGRVVRLRGYGNAINPRQAAIFIESVMEILEDHQ